MTMLDIQSIKDTASKTETAKAVFSELKTRQRSRAQINLRKLKYDMLTKGIKIVETDFMEIFSKLNDLGIGAVIIGRHGKATRFVWNYKLKDIAEAADVKSGTTMMDIPRQGVQRRKPQDKADTALNAKPKVTLNTQKVSITFNLSMNTRSEDLAALLSLVKQLEAGVS